MAFWLRLQWLQQQRRHWLDVMYVAESIECRLLAVNEVALIEQLMVEGEIERTVGD